MPDMSALPGTPPDMTKLTELRDQAFRELVKLTEELGLYDTQPSPEEVIAACKAARQELAREREREA